MSKISTRALGLGFAYVAAIGAVACGGAPPPEPVGPAPARPAATAPTNPAVRPASTTQPDPDVARREMARKRAVLEEMVFFDYDQATIRGDAKSSLDRKVEILRGDPSVRLLIEGHADERGSTEYNLALGMRRSAAIRDYLTGFGLAANRFETTSYGEGRPLQQGTGEAVWSRNRRGQFVIRTGLADR